MSMDEVIFEAEEKMEKSFKKAHDDFASIRTGKASPSLVENIKVDCYGTNMRLREVAGITTPDPRMIMIQPWDASNVDPVRKALEEANIGITPLVDGKLIRLPIPELSEERRKEMIKLVKKMAEDGRVTIRHIRRDAMETLKKLHKDGKLTEDDFSLAEKETQKLTDDYTKKIDHHLETKESELLKV
jgi:ribosome recycling factor